MPELLATRGLTKDYGQNRALDGLTVTVRPGEVVGLLGPNGSGKSTALRCILGFLRPTAGTAAVDGFDCWTQSVEVRRRVAYLPGELRLYEAMSGRELVRFLGRLRGQDPTAAVDRYAKQFDIDPDTPLTKMSSGMKRKIALMAVLLPAVPLVILDEPTNTLDPTMRDELLSQIRAAKGRGQAVVFSSHVLQEVESTCDRVLILRKGVLVHEQPLDGLADDRRVTALVSGPLRGEWPGAAVQGGRLEIEHRGDTAGLLAWLAQQPLHDVRVEPLGLGPVYRKYHG
jgi:ABC-2 type transport system ATP-binding protein